MAAAHGSLSTVLFSLPSTAPTHRVTIPSHSRGGGHGQRNISPSFFLFCFGPSSKYTGRKGQTENSARLFGSQGRTSRKGIHTHTQYHRAHTSHRQRQCNTHPAVLPLPCSCYRVTYFFLKARGSERAPFVTTSATNKQTNKTFFETGLPFLAERRKV